MKTLRFMRSLNFADRAVGVGERIAHHQGRVDLVLESELSNAPVTPSDCDIYLSGSPGMVYACVDVLERLGVGNERMFSDVFAYAPRPH